MCFNMALVREIEELKAEFRADFTAYPLFGSPRLEFFNASGFEHPLWPVICSGSPESGSWVRWGLIPHWVRSAGQAKEIRAKTLNARGETAARLPSFRSSYPGKTCLVIADGFYEPHRYQGRSYPFYLSRLRGGLMSLGGIYADWKNPENGETVRTFSIITVPATGITAAVHAHKLRMPLIIPEQRRSRWLDPDVSVDERNELIVPWEPEDFTAYPVSPALYSRTEESRSSGIRKRYRYSIPEIDGLGSGGQGNGLQLELL